MEWEGRGASVLFWGCKPCSTEKLQVSQFSDRQAAVPNLWAFLNPWDASEVSDAAKFNQEGRGHHESNESHESGERRLPLAG